MEDLNRALIAKMGWQLIEDQNSLWTQALKAKYCSHMPFRQVQPRSGSSWVWQSLLQVRNLFQLDFAGILGMGWTSICGVNPGT